MAGARRSPRGSCRPGHGCRSPTVSAGTTGWSTTSSPTATRCAPIRWPSMGKAWDPDWVVAPGETLREWREDFAHLPATAAAIACAWMPVEMYLRIEAGTEPITEEVAGALAHGTSIPAFM